jgi:hypothetical protein
MFLFVYFLLNVLTCHVGPGIRYKVHLYVRVYLSTQEGREGAGEVLPSPAPLDCHVPGEGGRLGEGGCGTP